MKKSMPEQINVWGGPCSGWNDVSILNEVPTTKYIRADLVGSGPRKPNYDQFDKIIQLEDQYQEVAKALGSRTFFHESVMERARELRKFWERG